MLHGHSTHKKSNKTHSGNYFNAFFSSVYFFFSLHIEISYKTRGFLCRLYCKNQHIARQGARARKTQWTRLVVAAFSKHNRVREITTSLEQMTEEVCIISNYSSRNSIAIAQHTRAFVPPHPPRTSLQSQHR